MGPSRRDHHVQPRPECRGAFGDKGLVAQLEDAVLDESGHSEETERILRDWPV